MKTIRFWHYSRHGEDIKIKLREGESRHYHYAVATDEGYHAESYRWTFDGERVTLEWYGDGRDCDGRLEAFREAFFFTADAEAGFCDDGGIKYPRWQELASSQRDHSAEAMGY